MIYIPHYARVTRDLGVPNMSKNNDELHVVRCAEDVPKIPDSCTIVHITRYPTKKLVRAIVRQVPGIKRIQFPPCHLDRLKTYSPGAIAFCNKHEILFKPGSLYVSSNDSSKREIAFSRRRDLFLSLDGEAKETFESLPEYGCRLEYDMVRRYFCLDGQQPISLKKLGVEHGFAPQSAEMSVRISIHAIIACFDENYKIRNKRVRGKYFMIQKRIQSAKKKIESTRIAA